MTPSLSQVRFWLALLVSIPVVAEDLRNRRIPNWACAALLGAAMAISMVEHGAAGIFWSIAAAAAGFSAFLFFHLRGGMGAGDVKLMAACGALVGLRSVPVALVLTALTGAALASLALAAGMLRGRRSDSIAYGPAIMAGTLLTLMAQRG